MKGYQTVHKFLKVITYFALSEWKFTNKNVLSLWEKLNDEDRKLFNFDISTVDWNLFLCFMLRGLRLYTFNESFDTLEIARVRHNK
jgi:Male sterility protein.